MLSARQMANWKCKIIRHYRIRALEKCWTKCFSIAGDYGQCDLRYISCYLLCQFMTLSKRRQYSDLFVSAANGTGFFCRTLYIPVCDAKSRSTVVVADDEQRNDDGEE